VFNNVKPIFGDNSFKDVRSASIRPRGPRCEHPVLAGHEQARGGVYKAASLVYGNFCWGGGPAEVYSCPGATRPRVWPDVEKAKRTQQQLIAMGMKGTAVEVADTYAEFEAPDKEKILHGSGEASVVRIVLYDNKARRTSGVTSDSIVQLKGQSPPFPWIWVLGGAFGFVIVLLLVVIMFRREQRRGGAPHRTVGEVVTGPPPGGGYGPPPGGGYGPPPGGGYPPPGGGGYGGGGYGASPSPPGGAGMGAAPMGGSPMAPAPAPAPVNPEFLYGAGPQPNAPAPAPPLAPPPNPMEGHRPARLCRAPLECSHRSRRGMRAGATGRSAGS
jgi:hypothetical protein